MSKLEEYKRNKEIKRLGLPLMYVVKSTREGVKSFEIQTVEITKGNLVKSSDSTEWKQQYKYKFDESPYESEITEGEISSIEEGYGSGFGDLWEWSYYSSLSKDDADKYAEKELQRIKDTYLNEVKRLTLEIVEILRKSSDIRVAENVFGEISQIWEQNIVGEDAMYFDEEDYNAEYDLHLKK